MSDFSIKVINAELHDRLPHGIELEVVDRVFADRTCGQWENGWLVVDDKGIEYFISESGIVYGDDADKPHEHLSKVVGLAPEIKAQADKIERQLSEAMDNIIEEGN